MTLLLPAHLAAQVEAEAQAAAPRECCGLMLGTRAHETFHAVFLHPAGNLAAQADRFEIDPADHFAAVKAARAAGLAVIGCYHSHPNGKAEPSAQDLAGAGEEDFVWLIAAPGGGGLKAFVYARGVFIGADCVMSSS